MPNDIPQRSREGSGQRGAMLDPLVDVQEGMLVLMMVNPEGSTMRRGWEIALVNKIYEVVEAPEPSSSQPTRPRRSARLVEREQSSVSGGTVARGDEASTSSSSDGVHDVRRNKVFDGVYMRPYFGTASEAQRRTGSEPEDWPAEWWQHKLVPWDITPVPRGQVKRQWDFLNVSLECVVWCERLTVSGKKIPKRFWDNVKNQIGRVEEFWEASGTTQNVNLEASAADMWQSFRRGAREQDDLEEEPVEVAEVDADGQEDYAQAEVEVVEDWM